MCFASVFSVQFRCQLMLLVPTLTSRIGRGLLIGLALSQLVHGPLDNTSRNIDEIVRIFTCTGDLAVNITLMHLQLLFNPIHDVIQNLVITSHGVQNNVIEFSQSINPLIAEVEDETRSLQIRQELTKIHGMSKIMSEKIYNSNTTCQNDSIMHMLPSEKMSIKFKTACLGFMSGPWKICKAIDSKIAFHFSNVGLPFQGSCPAEIKNLCDDFQMSPQFDEKYEAIKNYTEDLDKLFKADLAFNINYEPLIAIGEMTNAAGRIFIEGIKGVKNLLASQREILQLLGRIIDNIVAFAFIFVLTSASNYNSRYLKEIDFDNRYISWYFCKIDQRRASLGKLTLLPLTNLEKKELIRPSKKYTLLPDERKTMRMSFGQIIPHILAALVIFSFDYLITFVTTLVKEHTYVEVSIQGEHAIRLNITGQSTMAEQLRKFFEDVDANAELVHFTSNRPCVNPTVSKLEFGHYIIVFSLYLGAIFLTQIEALALRSRRIICSFAYPKREKQRILWLYNSRLHKRAAFVQTCKRKLQRLIRQNAIQEDKNVWIWLRQHSPRYFNWLKVFSAAKLKCLVCATEENKLFHYCNAKHSFCTYCWRSIQKRCLICHPYDVQQFADGSDDELHT